MVELVPGAGRTVGCYVLRCGQVAIELDDLEKGTFELPSVREAQG